MGGVIGAVIVAFLIDRLTALPRALSVRRWTAIAANIARLARGETSVNVLRWGG